MRKMVIFVSLFLLMAGAAMAQDPGLPDSLIVASAHVDSGVTFCFIPIYAVTDDSVAFYNLPLRYTAPAGGVYPGTGTQYFYPLTSWDERFDTVMTSQSYVRQIGFADVQGEDNPYLHTGGQRLNAWTLRFIIAPNTRSQLVVLDTTWDDRNRSVILGLEDGVTEISPKFVHGFISIGVIGTEDSEVIPNEFALKQNYPNPFNPETNIEFTLPSEQEVSLEVYNLLGQQVRTLAQAHFNAGTHSVVWDGRNEQGANVPSGIYFYKLTTPEFAQTNKMTMIR